MTTLSSFTIIIEGLLYENESFLRQVRRAFKINIMKGLTELQKVSSLKLMMDELENYLWRFFHEVCS